VAPETVTGGGTVVVRATGAGEIAEIKISPEAIDPEDPDCSPT
jgi:DNA-binding protein YbaB